MLEELRPSYRVVPRGKLRIVYGRIPLSDMLALQKASMEELSDKAVRDFSLAEALNAVAVWGEVEDCNALRSELGIDLMPRENVVS